MNAGLSKPGMHTSDLCQGWRGLTADTEADRFAIQPELPALLVGQDERGHGGQQREVPLDGLALTAQPQGRKQINLCQTTQITELNLLSEKSGSARWTLQPPCRIRNRDNQNKRLIKKEQVGLSIDYPDHSKRRT